MIEVKIVDIVDVEDGRCTEQNGAVFGDGIGAQLACVKCVAGIAPFRRLQWR